MTRLLNAPKLQIDQTLADIRKEPLNVSPSRKLEQRIVATLCKEMRAAGWDVWQIDDGGDDMEPVHTAQEAMEHVFNLDECWLYFRKQTTQGWVDHPVLLICGNGADIISDWRFTDGDADGFSALMDAFGNKYQQTIDDIDMRNYDAQRRSN